MNIRVWLSVGIMAVRAIPAAVVMVVGYANMNVINKKWGSHQADAGLAQLLAFVFGTIIIGGLIVWLLV